MNKLAKSLLVGLLENESKVMAFYGGGFKPPTKGHFAVVKKTLQDHPEITKFYVVVGGGLRNNISQDESYSIWNIYKKYLGDKVEIVKSQSPLTYIKDYIKDNPDIKTYAVIGTREGDEGDAKDFIQRKEFFEKYGDNVEVLNTITSGGISGTKARKSALESKEKFLEYIPEELTDDEKEIVWSYVESVIKENISSNNFDSFDYPTHIKNLTKFMLDKGLNLLPLPSVKFINDDAENANNHLKGKTAYYDPNYKRIVLYTLNRHPKDVMRSFAHEMIHHMQNCENRLGNITTQDIDEDDHLKFIEEEAYTLGNTYFRSYTGTLTEGILTEGRYDKLVNQISSKIFSKWKADINLDLDPDEEQTSEYKFNVTEPGFNFDVDAYIILDPGIDEFEVIDTTGAGTDKSGDFMNIHLRIDPDMLPQYWGGISMLLKDIVRHEIEHLTHNIGAKSTIKSKELGDDSVTRALIKAKLLPQGEYWKLPKEVDASLQGMYLRAKKIRKPLGLVLNNYLDSQDITPQEKKEILDLWRNRAKALSLPKF